MAILISSRNEYINDLRHINFQWNLLIRSRYSDVNCASPSVPWVHVPHVHATTEGFKTTHIELVWWGDLKTSYGHTEIYILAMATMNICTTIHNKRKVTNRDLNRAQCYFWCQCGKPNLNRWWVIASTYSNCGQFGPESLEWPSRSISITSKTAPQNRDLNYGILHFWSKCGDSSLTYTHIQRNRCRRWPYLKAQTALG